MSLNSRKLSYGLAINEALKQSLRLDEKLSIIGQGVKSPWYVGNTCKDLVAEFTERRVIDTPVSENAITGAAVGAAIVGNPTVVVHPRLDFMLYALDPIINQAANWSYMSGGSASVPIVIWGIINRGGEQGAQHSQSFHSLFAHIPGLKVVMPSSAYDAKGLMVSAIQDKNPVVFIDDRSLYSCESDVPEELYSIPIGLCDVKKAGEDITLVTNSFMTKLALDSVEELESLGVSVEIVDLRTIKPLDTETILKSVKKTRRLLVIDGGWSSYGVASEVMSLVASDIISRDLHCPVSKLTLCDVPAPASVELEKEYYISKEKIIQRVKEIMIS